MGTSSIVRVIEEHEELDHLINPKQSSMSILVAEVGDDQQQQNTVEQHQLSNELCWDDVIIEKFLGVGGFNCVSLARIPKWDKHNYEYGNKGNGIETKNGAITSPSKTMTTTGAASSPRQYAIKCLKKSILQQQQQPYGTTTKMNQKGKYVQGLKDLINEGLLLSQLHHPHIIGCYGTGRGGCYAHTSSSASGGLFLVLECMVTTLDHLLDAEWKKAKVPSMSQRLHTIALGIAKAMEYLHTKHHVIYRDLKPKNIGLDKNGHVKLFDFGIAHKLGEDEKHVEGCIGSLRYMAPETLLHKQCQYESDIYSYGVLLWELITLEKPYSNIINTDSNIQLNTARQFQQHVAIEGLRPGVIGPKTTATTGHVERIPPSLRRWIEHSWERSPQRRPNFTQIIRVLETNVCRKEVQLEKKQKKLQQKVMTGTSLPPITTTTNLTRKIDGWLKKNVTISLSGRKVSATS